MNLLAAVLLVALVPAPVAPEVVALGDSYASGAGAGAEEGSCRRSGNAYPALWAAARRATLVFAACSGATTRHAVRQAGRITPATTLVTVTVGGNDAGFSDVMTTCTLAGDRACERRVEAAVAFIRSDLPSRLDGVYAAVRSRTSATVVVLGYPRLFEKGGCPMSVPKRAALNRAADVLAEVTASRAAAAGFAFADVRGRFAGHGVCGPAPWLNGLVRPTSDSYHPNAYGHALGYLPALKALAR